MAYSPGEYALRSAERRVQACGKVAGRNASDVNLRTQRVWKQRGKLRYEHRGGDCAECGEAIPANKRAIVFPNGSVEHLLQDCS